MSNFREGKIFSQNQENSVKQKMTIFLLFSLCKYSDNDLMVFKNSVFSKISYPEVFTLDKVQAEYDEVYVLSKVKYVHNINNNEHFLKGIYITL